MNGSAARWLGLFAWAAACGAAEPAATVVDGVPFYADVVRQAWRETDDVIEGFDWSLPPAVGPSPHGFIKGAAGDPRTFPGHLLGVVNVTWQDVEPEEGRYDFGVIDARMAALRAQGYQAIELHVRGSVWDVEFDDASGRPIPPDQLRPEQRAVRAREISAPRWLARYAIPTARGGPEIGRNEHLVNLDIFQADYHTRYLKMVAAFGRTGIAQRPELAVAYVHMVSSSGGEENDGAFPGDPNHARMVERLQAWADAFGPDRGKLLFTGHHPENLRIAYALGMGQRNGYVERYLLYTHEPALGQSMDADGYLAVDESLPPIAENRAFGDENEEYELRSEVHVTRFGPRATWPHRYREASLRALQMRRNYLWVPPRSPDPALTAYVAAELGRQVQDAPDAWCYLRESYVHASNSWRGAAVPVRNFERWLYQRDAPGWESRPAERVDYPPPTEPFIRHAYVAGRNYDFVARQGKRFGFAVDDRFLSGGAARVAVKITYCDDEPWRLVYQTAAGPAERAVPCRGDGALRTATFFLTAAQFTGRNLDHDFEIHAQGEHATIRLVRIIRLTPIGQT